MDLANSHATKDAEKRNRTLYSFFALEVSPPEKKPVGSRTNGDMESSRNAYSENQCHLAGTPVDPITVSHMANATNKSHCGLCCIGCLKKRTKGATKRPYAPSAPPKASSSWTSPVTGS